MPLPLKPLVATIAIVACFLFSSAAAIAQPPGGPGGPGGPETELLKEFDANQDGYLNKEERAKARTEMEEIMAANPRGRRRGPGRQRGGGEAPEAGPKVAPADVTNYAEHELYDPSIIRTLFLTFENDDWEKELALFKPTDVEVPALMMVDGKEYANVGVSFRGASSFFMIPEGLKRSLNISMDLVDGKQKLYGYKSLNLLNSNGDAAMMSSLLYSNIAGSKIPTAKVNYVHIVINGESWGLYVSSQQFNKVFTKEHFDSSKGARWKVSGSPRGDGGLRYLGEEFEPYEERFQIKSKDKDESWKSLINLCKVLNETPDDKLVEALDPILNIDGALWFLACDCALANSDGYWTRASDYSIYLDNDGKFHILPHDMNEAFKMPRQGGRRGPGGPSGDRKGPPPGDDEKKKGFGDDRPKGAGGDRKGRPERGQGGRRGPGGGPGGGFGHGGPTLDPLIGLDDERMPLRSRLLSIPELQKKYLQNMRTIAEMMKWENIGPQIEETRDLIAPFVEKDTRKLSSFEAFQAATSGDEPAEGSSSLRAFLDQRSKFLLEHEKIKNLDDE